MPEPRSFPIIIERLCIRCGLCVQVCRHGVLELGERTLALAHPEDCTCEGLCEDVCPEGAIDCEFQIVLDENCPAATAHATHGGNHV